MKFTLSDAQTENRIGIVDAIDAPGGRKFTVGEATIENPTVLRAADWMEVRVGAFRRSLGVSPTSDHEIFHVATALGSAKIRVSRGAPDALAAARGSGPRVVKTQIPGKVLKILCARGDRVESGQPLLILEAMKMENEVRAPTGGTVEAINVQVGQAVESGTVLLKIGVDH